MRARSAFTRVFAAGICAVYFMMNCVLAHAAESNFWAERKRHIPQSDKSDPLLMAGLPAAGSAANPAQVLQQFLVLDQHPLVPSFSQPQSRHVPQGLSSKGLDLLNSLPAQYGAVRKITAAKGMPGGNPPRVVVFIQDAHQNADAQKNIAATVRELIDKKAVGLVALEGTTGPLDFERVRAFPDRDTVRAVSDFLLRENKISGPVHAALTYPETIPPFVGIEDPARYQANVDAYVNSSGRMKNYKEKLAGLKAGLAKKKTRAYNPSLLALDQEIQKYHEGQSSLGDYVKAVAGQQPSSPQVHLFLQSLEMETSLDFKAVEAERTKLIQQLAKTLDKNQLSALADQSVAYRMGKVRYAAFYGFLRALCRQGGVDLSRYPSMNDYIRYVLLADRIDAEKLFQEITDLEKEATAALAKSPEEKSLVQESRRLYLVSKLVDFSLTTEEWEEYQTAVIARSDSDEANAIFANNPGSSRPQTTGPRDVGIDLDLSTFESFSREAMARDQSLANNVLRELGERKADEAVMVAGGFHTEGVAKLLNKAGVTTVVFAPRIEKVDVAGGSAYLSVFTQEKTPLEKLFRGEKLTLAHNPWAAEVKEGEFPVLGVARDLVRPVAVWVREGRESQAPDVSAEEIFTALAKVDAKVGKAQELKADVSAVQVGKDQVSVSVTLDGQTVVTLVTFKDGAIIDKVESKVKRAGWKKYPSKFASLVWAPFTEWNILEKDFIVNHHPRNYRAWQELFENKQWLIMGILTYGMKRGIVFFVIAKIRMHYEINKFRRATGGAVMTKGWGEDEDIEHWEEIGRRSGFRILFRNKDFNSKIACLEYLLIYHPDVLPQLPTDQYLNENTQEVNRSEMQKGDLLIFDTFDAEDEKHYGVACNSTEVESKWGQGYVYIAPLKAVEAEYGPVRVYRKKPSVPNSILDPVFRFAVRRLRETDHPKAAAFLDGIRRNVWNAFFGPLLETYFFFHIMAPLGLPLNFLAAVPLLLSALVLFPLAHFVVEVIVDMIQNKSPPLVSIKRFAPRLLSRAFAGFLFALPYLALSYFGIPLSMFNQTLFGSAFAFNWVSLFVAASHGLGNAVMDFNQGPMKITKRGRLVRTENQKTVYFIEMMQVDFDASIQKRISETVKSRPDDFLLLRREEVEGNPDIDPAVKDVVRNYDKEQTVRIIPSRESVRFVAKTKAIIRIFDGGEYKLLFIKNKTAREGGYVGGYKYGLYGGGLQFKDGIPKRFVERGVKYSYHADPNDIRLDIPGDVVEDFLAWYDDGNNERESSRAGLLRELKEETEETALFSVREIPSIIGSVIDAPNLPRMIFEAFKRIFSPIFNSFEHELIDLEHVSKEAVLPSSDKNLERSGNYVVYLTPEAKLAFTIDMFKLRFLRGPPVPRASFYLPGATGKIHSIGFKEIVLKNGVESENFQFGCILRGFKAGQYKAVYEFINNKGRLLEQIKLDFESNGYWHEIERMPMPLTLNSGTQVRLAVYEASGSQRLVSRWDPLRVVTNNADKSRSIVSEGAFRIFEILATITLLLLIFTLSGPILFPYMFYVRWRTGYMFYKDSSRWVYDWKENGSRKGVRPGGILKVQTMDPQSGEAIGGWVGKLIRYYPDEFPQLWLVLLGKWSIIGPRAFMNKGVIKTEDGRVMMYPKAVDTIERYGDKGRPGLVGSLGAMSRVGKLRGMDSIIANDLYDSEHRTISHVVHVVWRMVLFFIWQEWKSDLVAKNISTQSVKDVRAQRIFSKLVPVGALGFATAAAAMFLVFSWPAVRGLFDRQSPSFLNLATLRVSPDMASLWSKEFLAQASALFKANDTILWVALTVMAFLMLTGVAFLSKKVYQAIQARGEVLRTPMDSAPVEEKVSPALRHLVWDVLVPAAETAAIWGILWLTRGPLGLQPWAGALIAAALFAAWHVRGDLAEARRIDGSPAKKFRHFAILFGERLIQGGIFAGLQAYFPNGVGWSFGIHGFWNALNVAGVFRRLSAREGWKWAAYARPGAARHFVHFWLTIITLFTLVACAPLGVTPGPAVPVNTAALSLATATPAPIIQEDPAQAAAALDYEAVKAVPDMDQKLFLLQAMIQKYPQTLEARWAQEDLIDMLTFLGRYDEALAQYEDYLLQRKPQDQGSAVMVYRKGDLLQRARRYDEAIAFYISIMSEQPSWNSKKDIAIIGLMDSYVSVGDYEAALAVADHWLGQLPENVEDYVEVPLDDFTGATQEANPQKFATRTRYGINLYREAIAELIEQNRAAGWENVPLPTHVAGDRSQWAHRQEIPIHFVVLYVHGYSSGLVGEEQLLDMSDDINAGLSHLSGGAMSVKYSDEQMIFMNQTEYSDFYSYTGFRGLEVISKRVMLGKKLDLANLQDGFVVIIDPQRRALNSLGWYITSGVLQVNTDTDGIKQGMIGLHEILHGLGAIDVNRPLDEFSRMTLMGHNFGTPEPDIMCGVCVPPQTNEMSLWVSPRDRAIIGWPETEPVFVGPDKSIEEALREAGIDPGGPSGAISPPTVSSQRGPFGATIRGRGDRLKVAMDQRSQIRGPRGTPSTLASTGARQNSILYLFLYWITFNIAKAFGAKNPEVWAFGVAIGPGTIGMGVEMVGLPWLAATIGIASPGAIAILVVGAIVFAGMHVILEWLIDKDSGGEDIPVLWSITRLKSFGLHFGITAAYFVLPQLHSLTGFYLLAAPITGHAFYDIKRFLGDYKGVLNRNQAQARAKAQTVAENVSGGRVSLEEAQALINETGQSIRDNKPTTIAFVCTGNMTRSMLAEVEFEHRLEQKPGNHDNVHWISGGVKAEEVESVGASIMDKYKLLLKNRGVPEAILEKFKSRQIRPEDLEAARIIIVAGVSVKNEILKMFRDVTIRAEIDKKIVFMTDFAPELRSQFGDNMPDPEGTFGMTPQDVAEMIDTWIAVRLIFGPREPVDLQELASEPDSQVVSLAQETMGLEPHIKMGVVEIMQVLSNLTKRFINRKIDSQTTMGWLMNKHDLNIVPPDLMRKYVEEALSSADRRLDVAFLLAAYLKIGMRSGDDQNAIEKRILEIIDAEEENFSSSNNEQLIRLAVSCLSSQSPSTTFKERAWKTLETNIENLHGQFNGPMDTVEFVIRFLDRHPGGHTEDLKRRFIRENIRGYLEGNENEITQGLKLMQSRADDLIPGDFLEFAAQFHNKKMYAYWFIVKSIAERKNSEIKVNADPLLGMDIHERKKLLHNCLELGIDYPFNDMQEIIDQSKTPSSVYWDNYRVLLWALKRNVGGITSADIRKSLLEYSGRHTSKFFELFKFVLQHKFKDFEEAEIEQWWDVLEKILRDKEGAVMTAEIYSQTAMMDGERRRKLKSILNGHLSKGGVKNGIKGVLNELLNAENESIGKVLNLLKKSQLTPILNNPALMDMTMTLSPEQFLEIQLKLDKLTRAFKLKNDIQADDKRINADRFTHQYLYLAYALEMCVPGAIDHMLTLLKQSPHPRKALQFLDSKRKALEDSNVFYALAKSAKPLRSRTSHTITLTKLVDIAANAIDVNRGVEFMYAIMNELPDDIQVDKYLDQLSVEVVLGGLAQATGVDPNAINVSIDNWEIAKIPRLMEAYAFIKRHRPERAGLFLQTIAAMLKGDFWEYLLIPTRENRLGKKLAKFNQKILNQLKSAGILVENWLSRKEEHQLAPMTFLAAHTKDWSKTSENPTQRIIAVNDYVIKALNLSVNSSAMRVFEKGLRNQLNLEFDRNVLGIVQKLRSQNWAKREDIITIFGKTENLIKLDKLLEKLRDSTDVGETEQLLVLDHLQLELIPDLQKRLNAKSGEGEDQYYDKALLDALTVGRKQFSVRVSQRKFPGVYIFLADFVQCCLAMNSDRYPDAMLMRMVDLGMNTIEVVDESNGKVVACTWLYINKDGSLVIHNMEIIPEYRIIKPMMNQIGDQMIQYAERFQKHVNAKRLIIGIPSHGHFFVSRFIQEKFRGRMVRLREKLDKIGGYFGERYYLDTTQKKLAYLHNNSQLDYGDELVDEKDAQEIGRIWKPGLGQAGFKTGSIFQWLPYRLGLAGFLETFLPLFAILHWNLPFLPIMFTFLLLIAHPLGRYIEARLRGETHSEALNTVVDAFKREKWQWLAASLAPSVFAALPVHSMAAVVLWTVAHYAMNWALYFVVFFGLTGQGPTQVKGAGKNNRAQILTEDFDTLANGWNWVLSQNFWQGIWDPKNLIIVTFDSKYKYALVPAHLHLRETGDVKQIYLTGNGMKVYRYPGQLEERLLPNYSTAWSNDLGEVGILFPLLEEAGELAVIDPNKPHGQTALRMVPSIEISAPSFNRLHGEFEPEMDALPTLAHEATHVPGMLAREWPAQAISARMHAFRDDVTIDDFEKLLKSYGVQLPEEIRRVHDYYKEKESGVFPVSFAGEFVAFLVDLWAARRLHGDGKLADIDAWMEAKLARALRLEEAHRGKFQFKYFPVWHKNHYGIELAKAVWDSWGQDETKANALLRDVLDLMRRDTSLPPEGTLQSQALADGRLAGEAAAGGSVSAEALQALFPHPERLGVRTLGALSVAGAAASLEQNTGYQENFLRGYRQALSRAGISKRPKAGDLFGAFHRMMSSGLSPVAEALPGETVQVVQMIVGAGDVENAWRTAMSVRLANEADSDHPVHLILVPGEQALEQALRAIAAGSDFVSAQTYVPLNAGVLEREFNAWRRGNKRLEGKSLRLAVSISNELTISGTDKLGKDSMYALAILAALSVKLQPVDFRHMLELAAAIAKYA